MDLYYAAGGSAHDNIFESAGRGRAAAILLDEVCIAMQIALESVGATLADVTRTTTYTTDMKAYFAAIDERFKYFKPPLPTSTLIGVACLAMPEMLVEIEAEAVIETARLRLPKPGP